MKKWLSLLLCMALLLPVAAAEEEVTAERLPDETLMTYYDDSLFVGDSVIRMFRNYVKDVQKEKPDYFSGIRFFAEYSYELRTAAMEYVSSNAERVNLRYKGSDATLAEIMRGEKPKKVFILAGLNEKIHNHTDRADGYIDQIMSFRDKYIPDAQIYFFSLTPVTSKIGNPRQERHDRYNEWLEEKCAAVGAVYIDIATALKGEDGFMPRAISHDKEFHLNEQGNAIWAGVLLDFAQAQYEAGLWTPETAADAGTDTKGETP